MEKSFTEKFYNQQLSDFKALPGALPFVSQGRAMFFAGKGNWVRAESYANKNGMHPIDKTTGGKVLIHYSVNGNIARTFGDKNNRKIWDSASRKYAASVKGDVKTFVAGANSQSTFRRAELPMILKNKNVSLINGINRLALKNSAQNQFQRLKHQGFDNKSAYATVSSTMHRKIALAEIRQDLHEAKRTGDRSLKEDCAQRLSSLKTQHKAEIAEKLQGQKMAQAVVKSQTPLQDRRKAIYDRAYNRALNKGFSVDHAKNAADMRFRHVAERQKLNVERRDAFQKADKASAQSYIAKAQQHRENVIRDRQDLAKLTGQTYKGPALMPEKFKNVDQTIKTREMYTRAQLEKNRREGHVSEREYKPLHDRNERSLSESRQKDLASYFTGYGQKTQTSQTQPSPSTSSSASSESSETSASSWSATYAAEAASYGYSYTYSFNNVSGMHASSQSYSGQSHSHSHSGHGYSQSR